MKYIPMVNSKGGIVPKEEPGFGEIEFRNVTFSYPTKKDV
jgi:hypothetical protein